MAGDSSSTAPPGAPSAISERRLLFILASVQFVNVLDFMMVMPLGPDFARGLGIPMSQLGLVAGSYTVAAAVAGLLGMLFLDRFDRRTALVVSMIGLGLGTAAGGLAHSFSFLVAARLVAGFFGGPATSLAMAIVGDVVPPQRRGIATAVVMGTFAIASVLGVPAGLELARLGSWRTPFFSVAALIFLITLSARLTLPRLRGHLESKQPQLPVVASVLAILGRPGAKLALLAGAVGSMSVFTVVPNLAAFLQFNLGYPRARLGILYMAGGACSLITMRVAGHLTDRFGTFRVTLFGTLLFASALIPGFVMATPLFPILPIFVTFMVSGSFRMVPMNALSTRVPTQETRARFMSLWSAVNHLSAAAGAGISSTLLMEQSDGRLIGMPRLALLALGIACCLPLLLRAVESRVVTVERAQKAASAVAT